MRAVDVISGIAVPDTALTRDTTNFIRSVEDDLLYNHSRRVFFFGAQHGPPRSAGNRQWPWSATPHPTNHRSR